MHMTLSEFERQQVQGDLLNERIEVEKQDLLAKHYKPTLPGNIHEALCNLSTEQFELMGAMIESKQYGQLGELMAQWNREYHESCAEDVATYNVMNYGSDDDEAA